MSQREDIYSSRIRLTRDLNGSSCEDNEHNRTHGISECISLSQEKDNEQISLLFPTIIPTFSQVILLY